MTDLALASIAHEAIEECERAQTLHDPMNSVEEGYAVICKQIDGFWEEVCKKQDKRDPSDMRHELIQVAAMAIRTIHDLEL